MEALRIFVASSSEGEPIARDLRTHLQAELGTTAVVEMWRSAFVFGKTAIEALETVADTADFALLVMTPDDFVVSRDEKTSAPRDNLVFELGLFIGALGRDRAIVARDNRKPMKLPSDFFSVTVLTYESASPSKLQESLRARSVDLAGYIRKAGLRPKWLAEGRKALEASKDFTCKVEGAWFEKISHPEGTLLSYFTIRPDPLTGGLALEGTGYSKDGNQFARWTSEMSRLYPSDRRIAYLWRGKHLTPELAHLKFHGYGTMEFKPAESGSSQITRGFGDFWDVDETRPDETVFKPLEIRRVTDEEHNRIMKSGNTKEQRDLVLKIMKTW